MDDPIARLLEEHAAIMAEVAPLRRAVADLERRGEAALPGARTALAAVAHMMGTCLLAHARREDEALFPALEQVFGAGGGPTAVMRLEHQEIHAQAETFRRTLREFEEVEHPAIVAGGEALRTMVATGASAAALRATGAEILRLLDLHFAKEEDILFPMARELLSRQALEEVAGRFEALESG
jgi:regulator of cell morphogenesis and NO signaling